MFKGIYSVYSEVLQFSAVKITPTVGKNRAHQSYLILNRQKFLPCDRDRCRMAETVAPFTIARRWNDFIECPQELPGAQSLRGQNHFNASPLKSEKN